MARTVPKSLNFITGNQNKFLEVQAIIGEHITVTCTSIDLPEIQGTIEEVTLDKCRRAAEATNGPVLVEDTCLCFKALNDLPGPYVKWFMQAIGHDGLNRMLAGFDDKTAVAVCTFAYSEGPGRPPSLFQGRTTGKIVPARGPSNFGWDPIFEYNGKTYAEMNSAEKNEVSHRRKALDSLALWLASKV